MLFYVGFTVSKPFSAQTENFLHIRHDFRDSSASFLLKYYPFAVMFYELSRKGRKARNNQINNHQKPVPIFTLPRGPSVHMSHRLVPAAPTVAYTTHAKAAKRTHAPRGGAACAGSSRRLHASLTAGCLRKKALASSCHIEFHNKSVAITFSRALIECPSLRQGRHRPSPRFSAVRVSRRMMAMNHWLSAKSLLITARSRSLHAQKLMQVVPYMPQACYSPISHVP